MKIRKILSGIRKQQCWRVQKQIEKWIKNCQRHAWEGWEPSPAISPFCSSVLSDCGCDYNEIININPPNHSEVMKLLGRLWFLFMMILCIFCTTTCSSRGRKQTLQAQEAFCLSGVPEVDPDKGQHFIEEVITTVLRGAGIKQKIQALYLPQSQGQGEHMNKTIKGALWTVASSNDRD